MQVFDIQATRAMETGLLTRKQRIYWRSSDEDVTSEAFNWFLATCGSFASPRYVFKRWYHNDWGWSLRVYYNRRLQKDFVRVVIQDPNHAMYFKLKWM